MIANIVIQSPPSPRPGTITSSTEKVMASTTDVPYMPSGGLIAALVVGLVVVLALVIVRSLLILNKVLKRRADNGRQRDPERIPLKDNVTMQTCKDKLKAVYMARMQRISTGLAEENQAEARHTDDIFTDLELQDRNNTVTIESHEQMIGLLGGQNNRFVLKGAAGCGKTTLVRRFGYDWGNNSEYMGRFDFVFVLKMKEMKKNYGLLSAILTQNFTKDQQVSKDDLLSSIRSSASNVLIILDGLDEVNWEVFNSPAPPRDISVKDILTVNALPESYVIVTTRPHMMHKLNKLSKDPVYNVIEATGFSQQKRNEYIERWFRFDKDKTKKLIHEIETSAFLEILAKTPIMLKLLCYIRKHQGEDKDLPARITELYQRVIDVLLKHQVRKHNSSLDAKRLKKVFIALGKVAFEGLMDSKDGTLVFARNKFPKRSLVDGLKLGLFLEEPDSHDHTVTFVHKTVQEYFAAFYVVQKTDLFIQQKLLSKVTIDTVQEVEYILLFSCGMNTKAARLIFQHISGIQDNLISDAFLWVQRFTLMLYYESQSDSLKAGVGSWLSLRYKEEFTAFQHYIENVTQSASHEVQLQRLDIYLHFVKDYSLIHNILQRVDVVKLYIGVLLSNKLREKLEQLDETISRLTVKPGETILCIDQREQGRCDEAASAELQDRGMTAIAALVPFCKTKGHGFGLRIECDIIRSQKAFSDIASSLAESQGVYFSVLSNRVSGYMKSLEPLIPFLKYLEFYDCGLSEVDLKSLAQLLPNAKMLCELHISGGSFSVQAASFLLEALAKHVRCPKMVLELGESELTSNESIETVMREIFSKVETVQGNVKNQFYLHK
ncbi:NACHT, LRR and PYD domains-containing protein 3-like [Acanthaster planci]|uniref:NACHT, LRR and PYD domains-containing protein 3-like n=1 Tax=Acanthaster planci TaxID=133434 RepID=A0A8B7ZXF6_ACAPL|nr:NACHT, LRR and PYD domains-containing protein 3-like [Acanthaster planci]